MNTDQKLVPVYVLKADVSNGFYRIGLRPSNAPKLAFILPTL